MRHFFILFFLITVNSAFSQGTYRTTVIGPSEDITQYEAPWAVQVYVDNTKTCSGVLINEEWVLTAAHCVSVNTVLPQYVEVVAGSIYSKALSTDYESSTLDRIVMNDAYIHGASLKGDLALLHLKSPLTLSSTVQPINLISDQDFIDIKQNHTDLFFYGWGKESNSSTQVSDVLKKTTNILIDTSNVLFKSLDNKTLGDTILLSYTKSNSYVCGGDSGGPLIYFDENGNATLAGIIKGTIKLPFLIGCDAKVNVFQNILRYKSWINSVIQQTPQTAVMPSFVDVMLGDTIYSCTNKINPVLKILNLGSDKIYSLNLEVVIYKDNVLQSTDLYKYAYPASGYMAPSAMDYFDSINFNYSLNLEKEHFYKIRFSLLDENNNPFTNSIAVTSTEKSFYFGKENSVQYINSTTEGNVFIWTRLLFSIYQEEDYKMDYLPSVTKMYRTDDFKKTGTSAPYKFVLQDSVCLVKDCYYSEFERQTQYTLFTKSTSGIDTIHYYKMGSAINKKYSLHRLWCINDLACSIDPYAYIVQRTLFNCSPNQNILIPSIAYNPDYTYKWFDVASKLKISDNDTLLTTSLNNVSLEITDRNNPMCKSISYQKPIYNNLHMVAIQYSNNTLTALADVSPSAGYIWFYNGKRIHNYYSKDLIPTRTGSYAVKYFTASRGDTCLSYFQSDDLLVTNLSTKITDPESDLSITLFPNPSTGTFNIRGLLSNDYKIELYTVLGEKVFSKDLKDESSDTDIEIILPEIPTGIYSIVLSNTSGTYFKKLILQ